jgi:uncharacterized protein GlcG (DUF336 family)
MNTIHRIGILSLILLCLSFATVAQPLQISYGAPITLEMAKKIATAAAVEAKKNNFQMVIAVIDSGGTLVYFEKIDGAQLASADIAIAKAHSANAYKRPTKAFEEALAGGRTGLLSLPGALLFEGGVPIVVDGKIVGAIGVSGGSGQQDGQVAAAGVNALQAK